MTDLSAMSNLAKRHAALQVQRWQSLQTFALQTRITGLGHHSDQTSPEHGRRRRVDRYPDLEASIFADFGTPAFRAARFPKAKRQRIRECSDQDRPIQLSAQSARLDKSR